MKSLEQRRRRAQRIIEKLRVLTKDMERPASDRIVARYGQDPYLILISCILSLRARDTVSYPVSCILFEHAKTPQQMLRIPTSQLESLLFPIGFYRQKANQIRHISAELIEKFGGHVPRTYEELISIKGIGPKTANLVLAQAFDVPAICVDTHVHRLANHLGFVHTKRIEDTQKELEMLFDPTQWAELNRLLVMWGQNVCKPGKRCMCQPLMEVE